MAMTQAVLVHGAGGGGWEWNVWREVLRAAGIDAVALDLQPVAGGLPATAFADYVAQVETAMLAQPGPRVLIGASLGGLLAMACARHADALVLVNPLPPAPWAASLPARVWPDVVPWQREARLASTRRALPDADDATALYAFRHWRDESGVVLREAAAGIAIDRPTCPVLCIGSDGDDDVPAELTRALAAAWEAEYWPVAGSHVGPLLGRGAATLAGRVAGWLSAR